MIKISKGKNESNAIVNLSSLALEHYERLVNSSTGFKSPLEVLKEERVVHNNNRDLKGQFLSKVTKEQEFKRIVTADLNEIEQIKSDYQRFRNLFTNGNYKHYVKLFGYDRFRKSKAGFVFANGLGVKVCLYCNQNYTLTIAKSSRALCHFDHFYSKDKYPFLAVCYYNLVPCCAVCNTIKSNKDFVKGEFIHPYEESLANLFKFETDKKIVLKMILNGNKALEGLTIKLKHKAGFKRLLANHLEVFKLDAVYNEHKDIVSDIYSKSLIYNKSRLEELEGINPGLFNKSEIEKLVLGNYVLKSQINQRPHAKFMRDIGHESGLLKKWR